MTLEVEQGEPVGVGVVEDEAEAGFLGCVEPQHLRQQRRAERGDGGTHRHTLALAAEAEVFDVEALALPRLPDVLRAGGDLVVRLTRFGETGQVALDVGHEDGHAVGGELLGHELQRLGLARSGGAGDEAVAVHHRQRQAHLHVGLGGVVLDGCAELEGGAVEGVSAADGFELILFGHVVSVSARRVRAQHCRHIK